MSIDPIQPRPLTPRVDSPSGVPPRAPRQPDAGAADGADVVRDRIELSDGARNITDLNAGERQAKIRELREQIDAGAYRVDSDGVARRMIDQGDI